MTANPLKLQTRLPASVDTNHIHLWLLDVDSFTAAQIAETANLMSVDERERAQKFIRGKTEYIASRWLLRKVLALYSGHAAADLVFERTDKGKPHIAGSDIQFSLSHSGHWALLAVGKHEWLGIDIECTRDTRDLHAIADSYFHPDEYSCLKALDSLEQPAYFYRLWTLKEAFFKAIGTGISAGLDKANFDLQGEQIRATFAPGLVPTSLPWQFYQQQLTDNNYCALAYTSEHPARIDWFSANAIN